MAQRSSCRSKNGYTTSPRRWSVRPGTNGRAGETPGPSSKRQPKSGSTRSTSSPSASSTLRGSCCPSPTRRCPGETPGRPCPSSAAPWVWPASPAMAPPSSSMESGPSLRDSRQDPDAAFAVSGADAGSDVSSLRTRPSTTRPQTSGCQRHQDMDHQRRHRRHPMSWWRRSSPSSAPGARPASSCPPARPGCPRDRSSKRWVSVLHTAEVILDDVRVPGHCLLGGKDKLDEKLAPPGKGSGPLAKRP